ncbi:MAG: hypothetical protein JKY61_08365 [Planctomycetes bacterium]|nr:hypothetical protein [Planctomycetota bacterium]
MFALAYALLASSICSLQSPAAAKDLPLRLREAVELPSAKERANAAIRLSKIRDVPIERWLKWMQEFGEFAQVDSGQHTFRSQLWVADRQISRSLEVYVPSDYETTRPSPLLVLLHGSGSNGKQMLPNWKRLAEQQGYLLLAPTALNSSKGYSFSQLERDTTMQALRWMRLHFNVDEDRIHLHGVSRGGHLTWDLGLRNRDHFASLIPAIGGPTWVIEEGRNNMRFMENLWDMPIRDLQGSQDDDRLLRNLRKSFERLEAAGNSNAHLKEFEDLGHSFRADTVDWAGFIDNSVRPALPNKLLVKAAHGDNERNSWLRIDRVTKEVREIVPLKVKASKWRALDEAGKALHVQDLADASTCQVIAERTADGNFNLSMRQVKQATLMLPMEWVKGRKTISVTVEKRTQNLRIKPSAKILLLDFVERFDRNFLPICEVKVKP